jgi:uncharacterized protein YutE (UPF0331/DUF86 family)
LVDDDRASARLARLEELLERLDEVREGGEAAYLADAQLRAAAERHLEVAIQICIDFGMQLAMEQSVRAPESYAGVFAALAQAQMLPKELADRLGAAARQRNLLAHLYLDVDDSQVFASLSSLDDLRRFAQVVAHELD